MNYSSKTYEIPPEFIQELVVLKPVKTLSAIAMIWAVIAGLFWFGAWLLENNPTVFWIAYPLFALAIAGRQGALLQIVHEGSHNLIWPTPKMNNFVGSWFASLPVGLTLDGYTTGHLRHHSGTNTSEDLPTDLEKYSEVEFPSRRLARKFLRDALGFTALSSFFGHNYESQNKKGLFHFKMAVQKFGKLIVAQSFVFLVAGLNPVVYLVLWAIPLITVNMVLLRVRGIAEHGAPNQLKIQIQKAPEGNFYTRSTVLNPKSPLSLIERSIIGSLACNFHHEHHLLPRVPFYNLNKVHKLIAPEVRKQNPHVYLQSYFKALTFRAKS